MKQVFKPLGIATAVAAASAGYVNVANAQMVANNALGDLALVPYYTVNGEWITGIHIVNTSEQTQVVKFRFRRAADSLDALDFNVVMSPNDVYAGFLSDDENGNIVWSANDTTCTVPATTGGKLTMPSIYREGAETGYVEIIGMGAPTTETLPIAVAALHSTDATLTPENCEAVRSNFFANGDTGTRGVVDFETSKQSAVATSTKAAVKAGGENTYVDTGDVLKVSYFIRDNESGVEFGDNAVHIQGFLTQPSISNQQFGWLSGDLDGFDFPDLDGGVPNGGERARFDLLRANTVLGVGQLNNEWTANPSNGAALDWVITMPGQYTMFDTPRYVLALQDAADGETAAPEITCTRSNGCDFRDIPATVRFRAYNREELTSTPESGELTVSPALPGTIPTASLAKETNVITFGGNSVLGVSDLNVDADLVQNFGWVRLGVTSASGDQAICNWNDANDTVGGSQAAQSVLLSLMDCGNGTSTAATGAVPMVGFAAWARSVAANPDASYGRIVAHSFSSSSTIN
ncbi:hypothetical protein R0137_14905 [Congregibacter brevis]|uniref:Uncharacterized protein n=1 Tax=Congregibacter brevis TaxID=3081201 RepID=A0ABZ0IAX7_9GAMM|nr:hypothetical protein R0137_14905 [Congregibacter sp. IMCC45268]